MGNGDLLIHQFAGVGLVEEVPVAECWVAEQFLGLFVQGVDGEVAPWWGVSDV